MSAAPAYDPIAGKVATLLVRSPFRSPARWPLAVVILSDAGGNRVTTRGELAAHFRANDLPTLARETERRKVPRGCVLVHFTADDPRAGVAGAEFALFDVAKATIRHTTSL